MKNLTTVLSLIVLASICAPTLADHHEQPLPETGYLGSFVRDFDRASKKLVDLANASPADKYGWRPTDEVRTVSESYVHTAMASFFLCQGLGMEMPEDVMALGQEAESKVTTKTDVLELLEKSIEHVREMVGKSTAVDLDEEIEMFGNKMPKRDVLLIISGHAHEHLGQLIAYARSNHVVPPWSQPADSGDGG